MYSVNVQCWVFCLDFGMWSVQWQYKVFRRWCAKVSLPRPQCQPNQIIGRPKRAFWSIFIQPIFLFSKNHSNFFCNPIHSNIYTLPMTKTVTLPMTKTVTLPMTKAVTLPMTTTSISVVLWASLWRAWGNNFSTTITTTTVSRVLWNNVFVAI